MGFNLNANVPKLKLKQTCQECAGGVKWSVAEEAEGGGNEAGKKNVRTTIDNQTNGYRPHIHTHKHTYAGWFVHACLS